MPDSTEGPDRRHASCADCGKPALEKVRDRDDVAVEVWLCWSCIVKRQSVDLGRHWIEECGR